MSETTRTTERLTVKVQVVGYFDREGHPETEWETWGEWTNASPQDEAQALDRVRSLKEIYKNVSLERRTTTTTTITDMAEL